MNSEIQPNIEHIHSTADESTVIRRSVAHNMRKIRLSRGLSLRDLATQTNLSTALLSQIERAVANPTVVALTRIATALDVSFADLTRPTIVETEIIRAESVESDSPRARMLFAMMNRRRFDISEGKLPAHQSGIFSDHGQHSVEYAYVVSGFVSLALGDETFLLGQGDAIRFSSEISHAYSTGDMAAILLTVVSYDGE
jgi:transcriptional regulator with XRE-family HTH domain